MAQFAAERLQPGDEVMISIILTIPMSFLAVAGKDRFRWSMSGLKDGALMDDFRAKLNGRTKLAPWLMLPMSSCHQSPSRRRQRRALLVDGAQSIPHMKIDVILDVDLFRLFGT